MVSRFIFCLLFLMGPHIWAGARYDLPGPSLAISAAAAEEVAPVPPVARVADTVVQEHGRARPDPYSWMRTPDNPEAIAYLEAENAYAEQRLRPLAPLAAEIAAEMRARLGLADEDVPHTRHGYRYQRRIGEGAQHPVWVRRKLSAPETEEVVLDIEALAKEHPQYHLGQWEVSADGSRVAFTVDLSGDRKHRIFVRTISTGEIKDQGIDAAAADIIFSADGNTLFYVRREAATLRASQVWSHRIGTDASTDRLIYEEPEQSFEISLSLSKSEKFVLVRMDHYRTSEIRFFAASDPAPAPRVMEPRQAGMRYFADHVAGRFIIGTNLGAPDFRVVTAPENAPQAANWADLLPHHPGRYVTHIETFNTFVAVEFLHDARTSVRVFKLPEMREISFPAPPGIGRTVIAGFDEQGNNEPDATVLRFGFVGPAHPFTISEFDTLTGETRILKRGRAFEWFNPEAYSVEQITAAAPDGEQIPITVMVRKDRKRAGGNPLLLSGYGAYGDTTLPGFTTSNVSLLDRGFAIAFAHVRGGRDLGQRWYEGGRLFTKWNTFTDFVVCGQALIERGFADPRALFAEGRSAGGLLVGVVANVAPSLFAGIVAEVPFVDVITSMSDPSAPLTTFEYDEWGNPGVQAEYEYIRSYSPYDNVTAQAYPAMFVTAGLQDSQVSFAEPSKWVARLRATKTDANEIVFLTDMQSGHSGQSGRLSQIDKAARIQAWLVHNASQRAAP